MRVTRRKVIGLGAGLAAAALLPGRVFAAGGRVFSSPIRLLPNRVAIDATLAGRNLGFLIDTGAPWSLIDNELARGLKLEVLRTRRRVAGVGGTSDLPWYDAGEVRFGNGIRIPHMLFVGARGGGFGPNLVGTFGSGLFTSYDSDLDFIRGEWRSYPDGRGDFSGLIHLPSRFVSSGDFGDKIAADATVDSFAGRFLLDTGMSGEALLDSKAAARSGLWRDDRPYAPTQSRGLGKGVALGRLVKAGKLSIGQFTFETPLVTLHKPGESALPDYDGVIGLAVLRLLDLTTQVSTRSLWAAPSSAPPPPRGYPMSGLWVQGEGTQLRIADVGTGSPAAAAGLQVGDTVIGVEFRTLLARITGPAGTKVSLTVERDGKRRDVVLTLTPYL